MWPLLTAQASRSLAGAHARGTSVRDGCGEWMGPPGGTRREGRPHVRQRLVVPHRAFASEVAQHRLRDPLRLRAGLLLQTCQRMPTANAGVPCRCGTQTFSAMPSESIQPPASAVGMRRKVVRKGSAPSSHRVAGSRTQTCAHCTRRTDCPGSWVKASE